MKKTVIFIVVAVVFIAVIIGANSAYDKLSQKYQPQDTSTGAEDGNVAAPKAVVGTAADFTVTDVNGNEVKLSDYFGKPIVINFWATWCGPCKTELPAFNGQSAESEGEVVFLMVNLTDGFRDTVAKVNNFIADNGYTFPVYFDTSYEAANAYGVSSIPMTVFIDKNGAVVDSHVGVMSRAALSSKVEALLA